MTKLCESSSVWEGNGEKICKLSFQVHKARHKETGRLAAAKICQLESDEVRFFIVFCSNSFFFLADECPSCRIFRSSPTLLWRLTSSMSSATRTSSSSTMPSFTTPNYGWVTFYCVHLNSVTLEITLRCAKVVTFCTILCFYLESNLKL